MAVGAARPAILVENRTGAATNIAAEAVVRAPADGYTLLFVTVSNAINTTMYEKLSFNFSRDIVPVASLIRAPSVLEVNPSVPAKTVPELIAYAKANPGKLTMASSGIGSASHVFGELFKFMTGVNLVHVPYRGAAPAVTDLLAGQVQVFFDPIPNSIGYIRAGKVRPLAITSATRSEALPDVPTVGEFVPSYEANFWFGVGAPKATSAEIVDKLNKEVNAALADPKLKARLADVGGSPLVGSSRSTANGRRFPMTRSTMWSRPMVVRMSALPGKSARIKGCCSASFFLLRVEHGPRQVPTR
jgi:tripartite-type tricarboxylate transporter receptor subunit TctC